MSDTSDTLCETCEHAMYRRGTADGQIEWWCAVFAPYEGYAPIPFPIAECSMYVDMPAVKAAWLTKAKD